MTTATRERSRYVDTKDHAVIVRKILKELWPDVKFRVRIERYSMGSSIHCWWYDGPTQMQFHEVMWKLNGKGPSDLTDYSPYRRHRIDGELVSLGGNYVFGTQRVSEETLTRFADEALPGDWRERYEVRGDDYGNGKHYYLAIKATGKHISYDSEGRKVDELVNKFMREPGPAAQPSPTLDAIEIVGES